MSGPRACAQSVCSPMAKFGYLLVAICSTIIILEWVIMVLIMPGQTGYSLLGAGIMPATHEGMQVKSLEPGWESEAEVPKGFNEPSFMAKFARVTWVNRPALDVVESDSKWKSQSKFCPACPYPQVIPDLGCAEIFMLVMQIYVGIGLLVLCIYVALKCGPLGREGFVKRQKEKAAASGGESISYAHVIFFQPTSVMESGVYPDCALPPEQPGGKIGVEFGLYKSPMPLPESRDLVAGTAQSSEIVQATRARPSDSEVGQMPIKTGIPEAYALELPVVVEKPMASEEEAFGLWRGSVCRVAWPPVVVHAGIQEVEYQLMVIPDSAYLLPFVGAVIIAPGQQEGRAGRPRSRKGVSISKSSQTKDLPKVFPLKSVPKLVAGQARLKSASAAHLEGLGRDDYVVIEFTELCPDLRYAFQVLARYPTVGPRSFHKIYEVEKISKSAAEDEQVDTQVTAACTAPVPTPVQVPLLEESQEKMQRWLQDGDGRLVLLTWLGLQPEAENPRQASIQKLSGNSSSNKQYEVQAAQWEDDGPEGREWVPCPVVSAPFLFEGSTCIAVRSLPFAIGKFRLFDPQMMRTGTATPPIVTVFERIVEPGPVEMIAKGQPPRTLAVLLTLPLDMPLGTGGRATCCQIRFRPMGRDGDPSKWEELDVQSLPTEVRGVGKGTGKRREAAVVVREEDGLELGHVYEFQVRLGDRCRMGNWSKPFRPLRFALSPPTPSEGSGLKVCEKGDRAEISWAPFKPDEVLAAQLPGFAQLPIEYTLSILAGAHQEPLSSLVTCETSAQVYGLHPLSSYSAMLVARWSRFGKLTAEGRDKGHVLMAAFVTSGLGGSKLTAELSVRVPTEQLDGYGPVAPATAKIPVEGGQPAAVTLDLDPYYVQPRLQHYSPDFVRKPTVPAEREPEDGAAGALEGASSKLPSLVPMPPPKFTTRDPLSFGLLNPVVPKPGAARPSPRPNPRRRLDG
ncbi:Copia protein [Durusdinium trenchii]|uniref:Copia protein n=1 Tax=Durusdinium trenchii TaxID=1381693 RepID=A0ABP0KWW3_9DINO